MAYVGNVPAAAYTNTVKDTFSGDGSTVAFTLSLPTTTNNVRVVVENVIQDPTVAYGVSGTTLTFTSAPPSGTNNIYVVHLGPAVQTVQPPTQLSGNFTLTGDLTQTGDFTLTGDWTQTGDLTVDTDTLFVDASTNRVGVGTTTPTVDLDVDGTLKATNVTDGTTTVGTVYVVEGSAKAWVNLNGSGTIAVRDSLNIASVTDIATGNYSYNYTSNFAAADYSAVGSGNANNQQTMAIPQEGQAVLVGSVTHLFLVSAIGADAPTACAQMHGDLA